jgi:hypothetical protein
MSRRDDRQQAEWLLAVVLAVTAALLLGLWLAFRFLDR